MKYLTMALLFLATSILADMQSIDRFSIDRTEVTVGQLRKLIKATGYVTSAEKRGVGLVYGTGWEQKTNWVQSAPYGTRAKLNEPAVHITFNDAAAYSAWAGKRLSKDMAVVYIGVRCVKDLEL